MTTARMALLRLAIITMSLAGWLFASLTGAQAHSVTVGYQSNAAGSITIWYGSYHGVTSPEGTITIVGPATLTKAIDTVVGTRPAGLIDGVNNQWALACSGGSLSSPSAWQGTTFTGVPNGSYSIQLTGSFSANWQPCDATISSSGSSFSFDTNPPVISNVPANINLVAPAGSTTATATWTAPTASDDVGVSSFTSTHASGSNFPIGTTTVTYTAMDVAGNTTTASFTVTVVATPPSALSYSTNPAVYIRNTAITNNNPTASGGVVVSYSISPPLPAGLIFNTTTGVISGTPTVTATLANYTVTATNTGGSTTAVLAITVAGAANIISFSKPADTLFTSPPPVLAATASSGLPVTYTSSTTPVCTVTSGGLIAFVTAGTCSITASQGGDSNFAIATPVVQSFIIGKAPQTISFSKPADQTYSPSGTLSLAATASSNLPVSFASTTTGVCTTGGTNGSVVTFVSAGTCSVTASQAGNANFNPAADVTQSFAIGKANQAPLVAIATPATLTFGAGTSTLSTTGGDGTGVVSYTVAFGPCSVSGTTLSTTGGGICSITATKAADTNYNVATSTPISVTVNQGVPGALILTATPPLLTFGGGTSTLSTTGGNGTGAITYVVGSGPCTVSGNTLSASAAGSCSVTATQAADSNYTANTSAAVLVTVAQAAQTISFTKPADQTFTPGGTVALVATGGASGLPVTFASTTGGVCTVSGATAAIVSAGLCSITASQAGDTNYAAATSVSQSFAIGQAGQVISFTKPADQTYTPGGTVSLVATGGASGLPVTFASTTGGVCTVAGSTVTIVATGTCTITASQAGNTSYSAATDVTQSFAIGQASQTIAFAKPADMTFVPNGTVSISGTATSGLPVTFASTTTSICTTGGTNGTTVTMVAPGACAITASQPGDTNYAAATPVSQSFGLNQITTALALAASSQTATIGQPITYTATVSTGSTQLALALGSFGGTVTFTSGGTTMCANVALTGVTATCSYAFPTTGSHTITAQYSGSGSFASASSNAVTLSATDNTVKTVQSISRFMGQRGNAIVSNGFDASRQIDRLMELDEAAPGNASGSNLTEPASQPSRPGAGPDANDISRMRFAGGRGRGDAQSQLESLRVGTTDANQGADPWLAPLAERKSDDAADGIGPQRFAFSTSLNQIRRQEAVREAAKLKQAGDGIEGLQLAHGAGPKARSVYSPFDIWIEGKYGSFRDDRFDNGEHGHFGLLTVGADYVLNRALLVGTFVQLDSMRQRSDTDQSLVEGTGWMVGPYATVRLDKNLFLQGRAAWGKSSNEVSPVLTYVDSFETSRWLASTSLTGRYQYGHLKVQPRISATYFEDKSESYVDSLGVTIPTIKTRFGQVKAGPQFSQVFETASGVILEPTLATNLIWNFASEATAGGLAGLDGLGSGPEGVRGQVELGLKAQAPSGVSLDIGVSYDGIGSSDYSSVTGRAGMRFPLN